MVLDETTEEGRLFHIGIVLGKKEFFRASLQAKYLVYCDSCDALVLLVCMCLTNGMQNTNATSVVSLCFNVT